MRTVVIGTSNTLSYYQGGGYLWMFLNWALGFRRLGFNVIWADMVDANRPVDQKKNEVRELRARLAPHGLGDSIALIPKAGQTLAPELVRTALNENDAASSDLLFSFRYDFARDFIARFPHSCLFETDPGIIQMAVADKHFDLTGYQVYYSNSEGVVNKTHPFFECGLKWEFLPTGVCVEEWPVTAPPGGAPFTTITQWWMESQYMRDLDGQWYRNDKREAFLPFLELPKLVPAPMELAVNLGGEKEERTRLEQLGWRVREAHDISSTPADFKNYIQNSLGEWSCAKPSYTNQETVWVSDRSVCFLASGRPCVVQHTGPSATLPDNLGMLRFKTLEDAAEMIKSVAADYPTHSKAARELAETQFSVTRSIPKVLERLGM
jgi:hypothetical protein